MKGLIRTCFVATAFFAFLVGCGKNNRYECIERKERQVPNLPAPGNHTEVDYVLLHDSRRIYAACDAADIDKLDPTATCGFRPLRTYDCIIPSLTTIERAELPLGDLKCQDADGHNVYLYVEKEEESGSVRTVDSLTKFLAAWGAILATLGLGWTLYRDLRDRPRLRITAHIRRVVQSVNGRWYAVAPDLPVEGASEQVFVVVNVTNVGRRPVQWVGWGGKYRKIAGGKPAFVITPQALPITLKEGDTHTEFTPELNPADERVKRLFIWDAAGKNWYLSRWALRKLKQESLKFQAASSDR